MQQWLPILLLTWALPALSSPLATSNSLSLSSTNTNLTDIDLTDISHTIANLSAAGIPSDFKLELQMGPFPMGLPDRAYYYAAIMALKEVALEDFNGVARNQHFHNTRFPGLVVMMNTHYDTVPRKYVVWGLLLACGFMDHEIGFGHLFFSLQWRGREVAGLAFSPPYPTFQISDGRSNGTETTTSNQVPSIDDVQVTNSTATPGTTASQTVSTGASNANTVSITIQRQGGLLRASDVYMELLVALAHAAPKPSDTRITRVWKSEMDDYHMTFSTNQVPATRSEPPYYTFRVLVESLALAADHVVEENQYYEFGMLIKVNDVAIASALLSHKPPGTGVSTS